MTIAFDIFNRFSGKIQFTAQIDCNEDAPPRVKIGLAVKWALKCSAYLRGAYLGGAYLRGADLRSADLGGADLRSAYLRGADLRSADLRGADLHGADLQGADLRSAYLRGADLGGADLRGADLRSAYLGGADLRSADLGGAHLRGAYLRSAKISDLATLGFPNGWSAYTYITESGEQRVQVGCRNFTLAEGRSYWANKHDRREVLAALDYAEAIAKIRQWGAVAVSQAAE